MHVPPLFECFLCPCLHGINLRETYERFSLEIEERLRTASLNLNFTGSCKKECTFF